MWPKGAKNWRFLFNFMEGWVKIHRKFLNWEWYQNTEMVRIFLHFLLSANHENNNWQGIIVKKGQVVIGRKKLSKTLGISQRTIRTCLSRLKTTNEITTETTNKYTIITLINWEKYQHISNKTTSKTTSKLTNDRPANDQQTTTNKNDKKDKKDKNLLSANADEVFSFKDYLNSLLNGKQRHIHIIGLYWQEKGFNHPTLEASKSALKRDLKPAMALTGYPDTRILATMRYLQETADYKWGLETVSKFIDENLETLVNKKLTDEQITKKLIYT